MRALGLLAIAGACSAEIAPDTYFCGPERLCPEGLACNNADNICTLSTGVEDFPGDDLCGVIDGVAIPDRTGDDTPMQGLDLTNDESCTQRRELRACLFEDDPGDWFQFDLAGSCGSSVKMTGRLTFAVAFEPIAIQVAVAEGEPTTVDVECETTSEAAGQTQRCFEFPLTGNTHYAVGLVHSNSANCDGDCSHNRYIFDFRLESAQ